MRGNRHAAAAFAFACLLIASTTEAMASGAQTDNPNVSLDEVVVTGQSDSDSLIGDTDTASQGVVLKEQLDSRPIYRTGELFENAPGLIVSQHSGEGKANQYYLRGFNLDHGTDMATFVDDMPINEPSHAHGQGYTDLNFIIPELANSLQYSKGPYFADQGDFATAGSVSMSYINKLDQDIASVGAGSFGYARTMGAMSRPAGDGNLLFAVEGYHLDGPWDHPDDYQKFNAVARYSRGSTDNGSGITFMGYNGVWNATNQTAQRAIDEGIVGRFGNLDPSDGGQANRFSLSGHTTQTDDDGQLKASAYVIKSSLDLWNDFTYFLYNPTQGDQFHQHDNRWTAGYQASYTKKNTVAGFDTENTFGTDFRNDWVYLELDQTYHRQFLSLDRRDRVNERSAGLYYQNKTQWFDKLRTVIGLRGDDMYAEDRADNPLNAGSAHDDQLSPKGAIILGPWAKTEFYLSAGNGFHSNDARAALTTVELTTYNNNVLGVSGQPLEKFPLMEKAFGEEVGMRTQALAPGLQTSLSVFRLNLASEQVFSGDAGDTSASGKSTRQGFELANFYTLDRHTIIDADFAYTNARFRYPVSDDITTGTHIAGSPEAVFQLGVTFLDYGPWFGGIQNRYFGQRPLTNDNSVRSPATNIINADVGYKLTDSVAIRFDVDNLLDAKAQDISYYYASRLQNEPLADVGTGTNDIHFHPAEPLGARLTLTAKF